MQRSKNGAGTDILTLEDDELENATSDRRADPRDSAGVSLHMCRHLQQAGDFVRQRSAQLQVGGKCRCYFYFVWIALLREDHHRLLLATLR